MTSNTLGSLVLCTQCQLCFKLFLRPSFRRSFSSNPVHYGGILATRMSKKERFLRSRPNPNAPWQRQRQADNMKTINSEIREARVSYPEDLGILQGTLIMPPREARRSPWQEPWGWVRMMRQWAWKRLLDRSSLFGEKFLGGRPYRKIRRGQTVSTAVALHHQLYTAFAE